MEELSVRIAVLEREVAKLHLQVEKLMTTDESRSSDGFDFHLSSFISRQSTHGVKEALNKLLEHKGSDGRYLVTRKVHWQAICRILVDHGIYPDGTDYRGFCYCMEGVCLANDCRVPLSYQSLKSIYAYLAVEKSEPSGSFARAV